LSEEPIIDKDQATKFYKALRDHLNQDKDGQQIISAFQTDPEKGSAALADYLRRKLSDDKTLANQLAHALMNGGDQFTTIVTGGEVDKIVNIARLGVLNLTIKRYFYVFSTAWQVVIFLGIVIGVTAVVAYTVWLKAQPDLMTGDFNIAVAEFVPTGEANDIAPIVSQRIFSFLDGQYKLSSFADVQVAHNKIGAIASAEEARALAEKINAHLVIYGDVTVIGDQVLVSPQFYVVEAHQTDVGEVNGEHKLAVRISLPVKELVNPSGEALKIMEQNTAIMTEFTKALVYLAAGTPGDLILAKESIDEAIAEGERYDDFIGKEVLYLFASDIVRRQGDLKEAQVYLDEAMDLNKIYGRGFIAQANIYYDQDNLYLAMKFYKQAVDLEVKPLGAYILEKASMGLGNICFLQYQYVQRNNEVDEEAVTTLADCALDNYQTVITSYNQQTDPEAILREMAAGAYYSSGTIYQINSQIEAAQLVYEQALKLTEDSGRQQQIRGIIEEVKEK
jgi:hypothetical protein